MQIETIRKGFEAFQCKLEPFEKDSKHSNPNSNHSKCFETFECKFEQLERGSKHSNPNSNHSKGFKAFKCKIQTFEKDSKYSNPNSNHSKGIQSNRMQIRTNQRGFEAFNSKFESLESNSKQSNEIQTTWKGYKGFEYKFAPFEKDSNNSNPSSYYSKMIRSIRMQIRSIWMQIWTTRKGFKAFECNIKEIEGKEGSMWMEYLPWSLSLSPTSFQAFLRLSIISLYSLRIFSACNEVKDYKVVHKILFFQHHGMIVLLYIEWLFYPNNYYTTHTLSYFYFYYF